MKYSIGRDPTCHGNVYIGDKLIIKGDGTGISDELRTLVADANKALSKINNSKNKDK